MARKRKRDDRHPKERGDARLRVAEEIRMKVSELLLREVRDPRLRGVHFTRVEMSNDLSLARLYWRPLPGQAEADEAREGLAAATGFLRRELAPHLDLRHVPELRFELDALPDEADRVEELLARLRTSGSAGTPGARPGGEGRDDGGEDE